MNGKSGWSERRMRLRLRIGYGRWDISKGWLYPLCTHLLRELLGLDLGVLDGADLKGAQHVSAWRVRALSEHEHSVPCRRQTREERRAGQRGSP